MPALTPAKAVEAPDDLIAWVRSLPAEATPELRKAYEFYKRHQAPADVREVAPWNKPWSDKQFPQNIGRDDCTVFPPRDCSWPFCGCEKESITAMTPERMSEIRRTAKERDCMVPVGIVAELVEEIDRLTKERNGLIDELSYAELRASGELPEAHGTAQRAAGVAYGVESCCERIDLMRQAAMESADQASRLEVDIRDGMIKSLDSLEAAIRSIRPDDGEGTK
jgi:hypothetical protein